MYIIPCRSISMKESALSKEETRRLSRKLQGILAPLKLFVELVDLISLSVIPSQAHFLIQTPGVQWESKLLVFVRQLDTALQVRVAARQLISECILLVCELFLTYCCV